jgi:hypothetical protein
VISFDHGCHTVIIVMLTITSHLDVTQLVISFDHGLGWFLVNIKVCVTSSVLGEHKGLCD